MKTCAICSSKTAELTMKQVIDGVVSDVPVCKACAAKQGFPLPASIADMLLGSGPVAQPDRRPRSRQHGCPSCHMTWADFQKSERLGCAVCYETFADLLMPMIEAMHHATEHCGHKPDRANLAEQVEQLQQALQVAIDRQEFEAAAGIRDRIREMETSGLREAPAHG